MIRVCLAGATGWVGRSLEPAGAQPYVAGTLLAVRKVGSAAGLRRGLDSVMEL